ncbi:MAG TPA: adenine phosphoribosyltransferase [Candidatus Krumholzibacteria bacterium]|nr:adenine phosphoribosyltransferase [Candidatus Krumholzibacteria bacterium]
MDLRNVIRDVPDFPKPGILFKDITPVLQDPEAYRTAIAGLKDLLDGTGVQALAAIESRGFLFAGPLGLDLDLGVALLRKQGKLPAAVHAVSYDLEYGQATLEVHRDAFTAGQRVVIVDDLLATGGTALASAELVRKAGGVVAGFLFLVELEFLSGRAKLEDVAPVFSLVKFA